LSSILLEVFAKQFTLTKSINLRNFFLRSALDTQLASHYRVEFCKILKQVCGGDVEDLRSQLQILLSDSSEEVRNAASFFFSKHKVNEVTETPEVSNSTKFSIE